MLLLLKRQLSNIHLTRGVEYINLTGLPHSFQVAAGTQLSYQLINFAVYIFNYFLCTPKGMRVHNGVLYIACSCTRQLHPF